MILYVDTSALVKLYVEETDRGLVVATVDRATTVATARVTYAEARAAFARARRERILTPVDLRKAVRLLDEEWGTYTIVDVSDPLVRHAGLLAERHALRGYDAVQLAAALQVKPNGSDVEFASFDARLNRAARRERLRVAIEAPHRGG